MKITYNEWIVILNKRLEQHNQSLRVIEFGKQYLRLSNDVIIVNKEFAKFKKRILNDKTDIWVKNMDNLFHGIITEAAIKSILASAGGKSCQKIHKHIKNNLNTGIPWNKGIKGLHGHPCTQETKEKISTKNSGKNNGMFGKTMSEDDKRERSALMKSLILSGRFTPNSNNRNTHWDALYNGKKYRSSWEALYQFLNPGANYEKLRIEYWHDNNKYVYIVDFIDHENKIVVEVKPEELCHNEKFKAKFAALSDWAKWNGYNVILADRKWFKSHITEIDYTQFDEKTAKKIKALYETNKKN